MQLIIIFSLELYMARTGISFEEIYYILVKVPHQVVISWVQIHLMNVTLPYGDLFLYFTVMISTEFFYLLITRTAYILIILILLFS